MFAAIVVIVRYMLFGPPIGGIFVALILYSLTHGGVADDIGAALILFILFSYPFGLISALSCGVYVAGAVLKKYAFRSCVYYIIAITSAYLTYAVFSNPYSPTHQDMKLFIMFSAPVSAFVMLRCNKQLLPIKNAANHSDLPSAQENV